MTEGGSPGLSLDALAELHPDLLPLAFLIGRWRGEGVGGYPTIEDFGYGQELTFSAAPGTAVLAYSSRSWSLPDGRPFASESGWWRPRPDPAGAAAGATDLEVLLAHPMGIVEVWHGTVTGPRVEIATDVVARSASAKDVSAGHRLYGLVEGDLMYAYDMAAVGQPLQPHLSARLQRVADGA